MNPQNLEEWAVYVRSLGPDVLWSKAVAANTLQFVQTLQEEGYSGSDITALFILFARRFDAAEGAPPTDMPGQDLSYIDLLSSLGE